jgi:hypothetical protein
MKRLAILLLALLSLAACVSAPRPGTPAAAVATPPRCRVGPDGGAPVTGRGIGGTGGPASQRADRGIGGTGAPAVRSADRGIGGTGITGIVTGFASVCVDGIEVALDDRATVDIDGGPATQAALRVGQLVAIKADQSDAEPIASRVSVRHEVSGPVEAVLSVEPGLIVVAGQRVRINGKAAGTLLVQPGVWVAVSGLRGPDGDIIASRLDPRSPGPVLVHGPLIVADGEAAVGSLAIRGGHVTKDEVGTYVTVSGSYGNGVLRAESLAPDLLISDPPAWFGPRTERLVLESYGQFSSATATMSGGFQAGLAAGFEPPRDLTGPVVMSLEAQTDGSFAVIRVTPAPSPATPAVMPGAGSGGTYRMPGAGDSTRASDGMIAQSSTGSVRSAVVVRASVGVATDRTMESSEAMHPSDPDASARGQMHGETVILTGSNPRGGGSVPDQPIAGGAVRSGGSTPGAAPGSLAGADSAGAVARIGGIRLLGAGIAGQGGHAAAGLIAPRAVVAHLTPRLRIGH